DDFRLRTEDGQLPETWDIVYTSGSTGPPTAIYQTTHDYPRILHAQRRMADIRGVTSNDRIANLFPLTERPSGSWLRVNDHAAAIGASVVSGLSGASRGEFSATRRMLEVVPIVANA